MSGLDVEALLDSTARAQSPEPVPNRSSDREDRRRHDRSDNRDRDRDRRRDGSRDGRRREKSKERSKVDGDIESGTPKSDKGSANGSLKDRRSSRKDLPDDNFRASGGDYYRGGGRPRTRSRSPDEGRYYRPSGGRNRRERDDDHLANRDRYRDRDRGHRGGRGNYGGRRRSTSPRGDRRSKSKTPQPTEDERDRRTIFVQQLAARLRTRELKAFFEKVGPVNEAQIVKDRVSGRSKGVGYVEFKSEDSVQPAIQLTGQQLLGIPIIAQLTEAEKNRQVRTTEGTGNTHANGVPFHRLYVGNIHFSITESDLQNVFEPFGELEFVQLQKEEQGRSRGYGFVQFRDPTQAKEALEKMNGFDLAGRPIRVGLGNDKFTPESTANLMQRFPNENQHNFQGSAFSGHGGRGAQAGGTGNFDRAGGRDNDKGAGGASALDDTDVAGVNFSNYSRDALMRKLARTDEVSTNTAGADDRRRMAQPTTDSRPLPVNVSQASRCVVMRNMFGAAEVQGEKWIKELEEDIKAECEQKYGHVVHIAVDPNTQGDVYCKFDKVQGGENAIKGLNGRFFSGRQISAQPVVDAVYSSLFTRTAAL
ncbi:hypothetical protein LTR04_003253 [Oleoguttula sp. CCFEE 6159]|nr:hypothetical protein LTR04_003253 [Oleoguttula sp. CCFEE 6159]